MVEKYICDALRDLVPFVQFQKRENHSWRSSVTFSKSNKEMIARTKNGQKYKNLRPTSIHPNIHGYFLVHKLLLNPLTPRVH